MSRIFLGYYGEVTLAVPSPALVSPAGHRSADPSRLAFARILAALSRSGRKTSGEGRSGGNRASAAADVPGPASPSRGKGTAHLL